MRERAWRRGLGVAVAMLLAGAGLAAAAHDDGPGRALAAGPSTTRRPAPTTSTSEAPTTTSTVAAAPAPSTTAAVAARPRTTAAPRPRTATTAKPAAPAPKPSGAGIVAAFYYGWYPGSFSVPGSHYTPTAGHYSSTDPATVRRQIDQMRYGGIQAAIASWWGPGSSTDQAFATDLRAADGTPFKWALYYELEGPNYPNQSPDQLRSSLQYIVDRYANDPNYLKVDGRPVIFVWPDPNDRCDMVARWSAANTAGFHVVQKRFPGSTGCTGQAQSWHDYSPDRPTIEVKPWSFAVGPGFWQYNEGSPRLARDPARFEQGVAAMAASSAMWKLVTTFNEWGEGTAIEPAQEWATPSGYGVYLDIMHKVLGSK